MVTANQMEAAANVESDRKCSVLVEGALLECDTTHGLKWSYGNGRITARDANEILRFRPYLKLAA